MQNLASSDQLQPGASDPAPTANSSQAQAPAMPCAPPQQPWQPQCRMSGWASLSGGNITARGYGSSSRWGNALSPYWQARGMAHLGGLRFETRSTMLHWVAHLPRVVEAPPHGCPDLFEQACATCTQQQGWEFAHACLGAWNYIGPAIQHDTRAALEKYAQANSITLPHFEASDAVIQDRCASDTWLSHPEYGSAGFSYYKLMPADVKRVFIVGDPGMYQSQHNCRARRDAMKQYIEAVQPDLKVAFLGDTAFMDFARLVYAPMFFKDMGSFGLWAALANSGQVFSSPLYPNKTFNTTGWTWSTAPVLLPDVAKREGLKAGDLKAIIKWHQQH